MEIVDIFLNFNIQNKLIVSFTMLIFLSMISASIFSLLLHSENVITIIAMGTLPLFMGICSTMSNMYLSQYNNDIYSWIITIIALILMITTSIPIFKLIQGYFVSKTSIKNKENK